MKWFRWYRGTSENPKFALVARRANRPAGCGEGNREYGAVSLTDVLAVWITVLEDASNDDHWGACLKDAEFIAAVLQWNADEVDSVLSEMVKIGLLDTLEDGGFHIVKWEQYQYASDRDPTNAQRQKRFYDRHKTNGKRKPNALAKRPDTDTDTDTDTDKKKVSCAVADATRTTIEQKFEDFKRSYPRRKGANPWKPARLKFEAAVRRGEDPEKIIAAVRAGVGLDREKIGTEYIPTAVVWLNQERSKDGSLPFSATGPPRPPNPHMPTDEELRRRARERMTNGRSDGNAAAATAEPTTGRPDYSAKLLDAGASPDRLAPSRAAGQPSNDHSRQRGMVGLGTVLSRSLGLGALRDEARENGADSLDDGSDPMAPV